jgi:hypothetical protein
MDTQRGNIMLNIFIYLFIILFVQHNIGIYLYIYYEHYVAQRSYLYFILDHAEALWVAFLVYTDPKKGP